MGRFTLGVSATCPKVAWVEYKGQKEGCCYCLLLVACCLLLCCLGPAMDSFSAVSLCLATVPCNQPTMN